MNLIRYLKAAANFKFKFIQKSFGNRPFRLLDVGAGNHSATRINGMFPNCEYYGLDLNKDYNNSEEDFKLMKAFYELDLCTLDYHIIPDNYFDGIWMAHVIEHLHNGDEVVAGLIQKLKPGGFFYIEYPGIKSTKLPSMYESLNFHDDPTHVRVYSVNELKKVFEKKGCVVIKSGTRRNWIFILAIPLRIILSLIETRKVRGNVFWDLLGFAEFLYSKKKAE